MVKGRAIKSNKEKRTIVSNKKKERDLFKKEMDMVLLKKRIGEIIKKISDEKRLIEDYNDKYKKNIEIMNEKYTDNSLYQTMFQNYMKNEYTLICISFINKIIINSKNNNLEQYEGKYNFNKIIVSLAKELLLNEFELILFSLYLECIDISSFINNFTLENSLLFLSFYVKKMTINKIEFDPIKSFLIKKYNNFEENYENWLGIAEKKINSKIYFSYLEINNRFKEYNAPFNVYCSDNYIDYNYIVDKILTMSLPYVDIKKNSTNSNINNITSNSIISDQNKDNKNINIKNPNNIIDNENKKNLNNNDNNNTNLNTENYNKIILHPEPFINIGLKPQINTISNIDPKNVPNNLNYNFINKNNINFINDTNNKNNINININNINNIPSTMTPNNLLHSLGTINRYMIPPGNGKMLINPNLLGNINNIKNLDYNKNILDITKTNVSQQNRQIEEDYIAKKMSSNLINPMQTPSQSSFIFQQKPSLMEMNLFNKINSSHLFDDEGDTLKQILRASNDNYFRSSMSFDSPKYPYGAFINNSNTNFTNMNNNGNNIIEQKGNDINKIKNSKEIPFRPLNIVCNKNTGANTLNPNKIIYSNMGIDIEKNNTYINNEKK